MKKQIPETKKMTLAMHLASYKKSAQARAIERFYHQHRVAIMLIIIGLLCIIPFFTNRSYVLGVLCRILLYTILAGSLNTINGYSGQFCLGIAGFFCVGAYSEAILATAAKMNFWIILPIAGLITAFIGLLVALPTLKMQGIYLAIVTLGFSEIARLVALNWTSLTGGPMGIKGIPVPVIFGFAIRSTRHFYYFYLVVAIIFVLVTSRVIRSRIGRAWMSIREDELAAKSLGVYTSHYKALNFMYGAFWAGIAGAIYAPYVRFIDSTYFTLDEGWNILSMMIIGGQGTLIGPIVGSVIVNYLTELLRPIGQWRLVAYALLIIVMMWWRPQGLAGASNSIVAVKGDTKLRKKQPAKGGKR